MLSQVLPDETVVAQSVIPNRSKSAFARTNSKSFSNLSADNYDNDRFIQSFDDDYDPNYSKYLTRSYKNDQSLITASLKKPNKPKNEYYYHNRNRSDSSSSLEEEGNKTIPSAHEIVKEKNINERLRELERTNLNLRRMLELVGNDPSRSLSIGKSPTHRLLLNKSMAENPLGPPTLRHGRIGSSWRHIKQTNNYSNSNLLFIDGTVRINDSTRYPSARYGYPPKIPNNDEELTGLSSQSLGNIMPVQYVRQRPSNLSAYNNQYNERAKQGFEYWNKDRKLAENTKPKAKLYTTGAYKTFYGLSDSVLKT